MPWTYNQRSGTLTGPNGQVYQGYSGAPAHVNNPASERLHNAGPIPRGSWDIDLHPYAGAGGPHSLRLTPRGHNAHGRRNIVIHGENSRNPGAASTGCIVVPLRAREDIVRSGDTTLEVRE